MMNKKVSNSEDDYNRGYDDGILESEDEIEQLKVDMSDLEAQIVVLNDTIEEIKDEFFEKGYSEASSDISTDLNEILKKYLNEILKKY